ncbi:DegT/DnrJ/EryC1/StrS family aminotransferase [Agromyces ramosus]|uniref:dTDP-4-amino-4,6-dideoxygalactose transaminase n=1 Tax=Agromyces ramosus TaxID=33879 RepID=A0ABU0R863_9MICO|nr:DegT/DnrJ/EryC1/StrS family aminotransferase [Agromyces ramosus]MDQ0894276.1 dTDP-4-amino-4,6-dideoxygalactose transaminase [Agromyces ramosus]
MMTVPFSDLVAQQHEIDGEVRSAMREVFESGAFIGGPAVAAFEHEYAAYTGTRHCVGMGNGTDALEAALRAVGVGRGDEVVIPANTFIATAEAVLRAGATPVLVDVDEHALLIDPAAAAAAVGPATRAIVAVHLYGQPAPVERLEPIARSAGAVIVEDAAQSHGARRHGGASGGLASIAATSFYPGKNLGAAGDAGAVTTDDPELARTVRMLGSHGSERRYAHELLGFNSRLDAVQAVVLSAKLRRLEDWNVRRRAIAVAYGALLHDLDELTLPVVAEGNEHVWHLYVVRVRDRERVAAELAEAGVATGIHYPVPLHRSPALVDQTIRRTDCPVTDAAAGEILSLPMFPHMTASQVVAVTQALRTAVHAPALPAERVVIPALERSGSWPAG